MHTTLCMRSEQGSRVPSSAQGIDPRQGLPKLREPWVQRRGDDGGKTCTQMYYARRGEVTEEMAFVAAREQLPVDFVVSEVRRHSAPAHGALSWCRNSGGELLVLGLPRWHGGVPSSLPTAST